MQLLLHVSMTHTYIMEVLVTLFEMLNAAI
jgi:hypothetical protein